MKKEFVIFSVKFLFLFFFFYGLSKLVIGISAPEGYYSEFVHRYLDYISALRYTLMKGAAFVSHIWGYQTTEESNYLLRIVGRRGVIIAYDCAGYGVLSFWLAFVISYPSSFMKKISWIILGSLALWLINVLRIGLFLISINERWKFPFGWDHHTWFNIIAYGAIFAMMYFFDKRNTNKETLIQ
jgi:exosortase/archaeosortase family protein